MGTKILGTELPKNGDILHLEACHTAFERNTVHSLYMFQFNVVKNSRLQGIESCKAVHNDWIAWICKGCPIEHYRSAYRHGAKASLFRAKAYYNKLLANDPLNAVRFRDLITSVLRSYQVVGPTDQEMEEEWYSKARPRIEKSNSKEFVSAMIKGLVDPNYEVLKDAPNGYYSTLTLSNYCWAIAELFNRAEKSIQEGHPSFFAKACQAAFPDIQVDSCSLLLKASPSQVFDPEMSSKRTFRSISAQALDIRCLANQELRQPSWEPIDLPAQIVNDPAFAAMSLYSGSAANNLLDYIYELDDLILSSYKNNRYGSPNANIGIANNRLYPTDISVPDNIELNIGRGCALQDKAGKLRAVAISCYMINHTFQPVHDALYRCLKALEPFDSTDQQIGINAIQQWTEHQPYICSADLSAATDTLPLEIQAYILYRVFKIAGWHQPEVVASHWLGIIRNIPFKDPFFDPDDNPQPPYYYETGSPMGVYTSWAMLSLTNHVVNRAAGIIAYRHSDALGYQPDSRTFIQYRVCGDDDVTKGYFQSRHYMKFMDLLGVTVNRSKSHICKMGSEHTIAEFCKRVAHNGEIVSGESPKKILRGIYSLNQKDEVFMSSAIAETIKLRRGSLSKRSTSKVLGHPVGNRKSDFIPLRYGGLGLTDDRSFHEVMLSNNFIYLYIYRRLRGTVNSTLPKLDFLTLSKGKIVSGKAIAESDFKFKANSRLFRAYFKPEELVRSSLENQYRNFEFDFDILLTKLYTAQDEAKSIVADYEHFLIGDSSLYVQDLIDLVQSTFDRLSKVVTPLKTSVMYSDEITWVDNDLARFDKMCLRKAIKQADTNSRINVYFKPKKLFTVNPVLLDADSPEMRQYLVESLDEIIFKD